LDSKAPRHVLLINTDQSVLLVAHDLLQDAGYSVSLLSYHDHDLDEIKRLAPDVIVLDYRWAGDDNGWSLLHLLRLEPATVSIPIVLCTGAAREIDALRDHLATLGVTGVLKPFRAETLLAAIADASTWSDAYSASTYDPCDRGANWMGRR
jgi:CheY-like chemotaxis protein